MEMTSSWAPADGSSTSNFSATALDVVEPEPDSHSEGTIDSQTLLKWSRLSWSDSVASHQQVTVAFLSWKGKNFLFAK